MISVKMIKGTGSAIALISGVKIIVLMERTAHPAWALTYVGLAAVIAPGFSDIFSSNASKNGILTVMLPKFEVDRLLEVARKGRDIQSIWTVRLSQRSIRTGANFRWTRFASAA